MDNKQSLIELRDKVMVGDDITFADIECCFARQDTTQYPVVVDYVIGANNGSLDAAKALHEAVLPGWFIRSLIQMGVNIWSATIWPEMTVVGNDNMVSGKADTPACAWLIAILEAMISEAE